MAASNPVVEKEILANMTAYKEAMIQNNAAVLEKLLSEDLSYVHSGGQLESKADILRSVTTGKNVVTRLEFSGMSVRTYMKARPWLTAAETSGTATPTSSTWTYCTP